MFDYFRPEFAGAANWPKSLCAWRSGAAEVRRRQSRANELCEFISPKLIASLRRQIARINFTLSRAPTRCPAHSSDKVAPLARSTPLRFIDSPNETVDTHHSPNRLSGSAGAAKYSPRFPRQVALHLGPSGAVKMKDSIT